MSPLTFNHKRWKTKRCSQLYFCFYHNISIHLSTHHCITQRKPMWKNMLIPHIPMVTRVFLLWADSANYCKTVHIWRQMHKWRKILRKIYATKDIMGLWNRLRRIQGFAVFQFLESGLYRDVSSVSTDHSHLLKTNQASLLREMKHNPSSSIRLKKKKTLDTILDSKSDNILITRTTKPGFKCKCKMCGSLKRYSWKVTATQFITKIYKYTSHISGKTKRNIIKCFVRRDELDIKYCLLTITWKNWMYTDKPQYILLYFM